jgi:Domain of unknown function (DUF5658)
MGLILKLTVLLLLLQVSDVGTTAYALKRGIGAEGNPVVAKLIKAMGIIPGLLMVKALLLGPVIYIAYTRDYTQALIVLVVIYAAVVINNVVVIRKLK